MKPLRKRRKLLSKEDIRLWAHVTRSVAPLPQAKPVEIPDDPAVTDDDPQSQPEPPLPLVQLRPKSPLFSPTGKQSTLTHGVTDNMDKRTAKRFKKGTMTIDGRLDLHGMTRDHAHDALMAFMKHSIACHRRVVLVITGKGRLSAGQGILKGQVPHWLNEPPIRNHIVSFSYAQPKHGGEGALYVYLKRDRNQ